MKSGSPYFHQSGPQSSASGSNTLSIVSKTTTYTADTADDLILCSTTGGAWQLSLYTAVGNNGRVLRVLKTTNDFTKLTIDGDGTETINGAANTSLCTQYEEVTLVSDGSNWLILDRRIPDIWTSYTPTYTAMGTVTGSAVYWKRAGSDLLLRGEWIFGTPTAAEGRVSLPSGLTTVSTISTVELVGTGTRNQNGAIDLAVLAEPSKAYLVFGLQTATTNGLTKANGDALTANGNIFSIWARVPILDWAG